MTETVSRSHLETLLQLAAHVARRAGKRILEVQRRGYRVAHKADASPVTTADLAAHETIVEGLGTLAPQLPVLSEESEAQAHIERKAWKTYWLVDPLDGTPRVHSGRR